MIPFFALLTAFYLLLLVLVLIGLLGLKKQGEYNYKGEIALLIAARNEAERIQPLLHSLEKMDFPPARLDVYFIDDASSDQTPEILKQAVQKKNNWHYLRLEDDQRTMPGKKSALQAGLDASQSEWIVTTDADCEVAPGWLKSLSAYFGPDTQMVIGHAPLHRSGRFRDFFLQFDNLFSAVASAAPAGLGFPISSIGRNLAYRRQAMNSIGGYKSIRQFKSGDDVHLTEQFRKRVNGKIVFSLDEDSFVFTNPLPGIREFFQQHIRKNSKTLKKSAPSVLLSLVLFSYFLLFFTIPFVLPGQWTLWLIPVLLRLTAEFVVLVFAAKIFHKLWIIKYIFPMQLIYPVMIILFSLAGIFQVYKWKN